MNPAAVHQTEKNIMIICRSLNISEEIAHALGVYNVLPDGSCRLQDVEILQNVGERVESQNSQTSQSNPDSSKDQGHEGRRDGEEVNKGVELEHEDKLVQGVFS